MAGRRLQSIGFRPVGPISAEPIYHRRHGHLGAVKLNISTLNRCYIRYDGGAISVGQTIGVAWIAIFPGDSKISLHQQTEHATHPVPKGTRHNRSESAEE